MSIKEQALKAYDKLKQDERDSVSRAFNKTIELCEKYILSLAPEAQILHTLQFSNNFDIDNKWNPVFKKPEETDGKVPFAVVADGVWFTGMYDNTSSFKVILYVVDYCGLCGLITHSNAVYTLADIGQQIADFVPAVEHQRLCKKRK